MNNTENTLTRRCLCRHGNSSRGVVLIFAEIKQEPSMKYLSGPTAGQVALGEETASGSASPLERHGDEGNLRQGGPQALRRPAPAEPTQGTRSPRKFALTLNTCVTSEPHAQGMFLPRAVSLFAPKITVAQVQLVTFLNHSFFPSVLSGEREKDEMGKHWREKESDKLKERDVLCQDGPPVNDKPHRRQVGTETRHRAPTMVTAGNRIITRYIKIRRSTKLAIKPKRTI